MKRNLFDHKNFLLAVAMLAALLLLARPSTLTTASAQDANANKKTNTNSSAPKKSVAKKPVSKKPATKKSTTASSNTANATADERTYWESIRNSTDPADFRAYLKKYPKGTYETLATNRLNSLEAAARSTSASSSKPIRNGKGIEMVWIPPGSFDMGSNNGESNEKPVHRVTIANGFFMGKYEVTQGQWQAVMGSNPSNFKGGDDLPVEQVSWNDAQEFINKLNEMNDGYSYRLPTESEWEYACRAGTTGDYYAAYPDDIAWYVGNSGSKTHKVGTKQANAFGLYDMLGNVWEWCHDWYVNNYEGTPTDGSARFSGGEMKTRAYRGGSWNFSATSIRSASRLSNTPASNSYSLGFRLVAVARERQVAESTTSPKTASSPSSSTSSSIKPIRNSKGIEMVWIPPGSFDMGSNNGSDNQKPVHRVTIAHGFFMGKYEVTQGQWQAVMGSNPSFPYWERGDNFPVEQVSWFDVQEFINKLNEMNDGYKYRFPTEAEWEYACRAGTTGDYYASDLDDIAWYSDNSGKKTHKVGTKQPNAFGLFDMLGNVGEWCRDWYVGNYEGAPTDGTARLTGGEMKNRTIRGGGINYIATVNTCAMRVNLGVSPDSRSSSYGFRLVAVARTQ